MYLCFSLVNKLIFFFSNSYCESEIDRYITWPGQALSYKMGERKIKDTLKTQREKSAKNGKTFDLIKFHDAVLNCNGPLSSLQECVANYLRTNDVKSKPSARQPVG